jgi:hypothetical protein
MLTIFASKNMSLSVKFTTFLVTPLFFKEHGVFETFKETFKESKVISQV